MDTPILPNKRDDEDKRDERPLQLRYLPRPEVLRIIAGTLAIVGALIGLISRLDAPAAGPSFSPGPFQSAPTAIYGQPDPARKRVCLDEIRPLPTHGAWRCRVWQPLDAHLIAKSAADPGGPCTHRIVADANAWECWTKTAIPAVALGMPYKLPVMFGDVRVGNPGSSATGPWICTTEIRHKPDRGTWMCGGWQRAPANFRFVRPLDPGGPCTYRLADQQTGIWACRSAQPLQP